VVAEFVQKKPSINSLVIENYTQTWINNPFDIIKLSSSIDRVVVTSCQVLDKPTAIHFAISGIWLIIAGLWFINTFIWNNIHSV
jgi:hypothetical protein